MAGRVVDFPARCGEVLPPTNDIVSNSQIFRFGNRE